MREVLEALTRAVKIVMAYRPDKKKKTKSAKSLRRKRNGQKP